MKRTLLLSSALALGLAAGAATLPHVAEAASPNAAGPKVERSAQGDWHRHGMFQGRHMHGMAFEHVDGGLAYLKAELKITPEQESAWAPFEAAVREQAATAKKNFEARKAEFKTKKDDADWTPPTVPERMTRMEDRLNTRLEAVKALEASTNNLYSALTDEQKKTADSLLPSPMLPFPL